MKLRITSLLMAVAATALLAPPLWAGRTDVGTSGAAFLKLNAGSRPAAMGEAFAGIADDVTALSYNPAGTARIARPQFTAQYGSWFQGMTFNAIGFVYPTAAAGTFGVGIINLSSGDIEKRAADTLAADGTFTASDYAYLLHYARAFGSRVSAGANIKAISQSLDDHRASTVAGDAGVLWQTPFTGLSCGAAVQNLGNGIRFIRETDPLPLNIKCGFGYRQLLAGKSAIIAGLDYNLPRDNDGWLGAGIEWQRHFAKNISAALRGGYKTVAAEELGGLAGMTAGAGATWKEFSVDVAWVPYGDLGNTFRYSLLVKF
jgi:hypothetical protein